MKKEDRIWSWALAALIGIIVVWALSVQAAEAADRFKLEVGPNFVGHRTTFEYPANQESWFVTGTSFSGNGMHASGSVELSNVVSIGARFDHNFLSDPTFFEIDRRGERNYPNGNERRGSGQRAEGFVGFQIPKVGILEAGVARHSFGRHWVYLSSCNQSSPCGPRDTEEINSYNDMVAWGPVIGLTKEVNLRSFILGGGIWGYPRMSQSQEWGNDRNGTWRESSGTVSGIKIEATGGYKLTPHTMVKGGYQYSRTSTPDPFSNSSWRIDTVRTEHAIIARYVISF